MKRVSPFLFVYLGLIVVNKCYTFPYNRMLILLRSVCAGLVPNKTLQTAEKSSSLFPIETISSDTDLIFF